jgi:hypothetical protein
MADADAEEDCFTWRFMGPKDVFGVTFELSPVFQFSDPRPIKGGATRSRVMLTGGG